MNHSKYAFEVSSRKFLGFLVNQRGIDLDPTKARAIVAIYLTSNLERIEELCRKSVLLEKIYLRVS